MTSVDRPSKTIDDPFPQGSVTPAIMHHHVMAVSVEDWNKLFAYKERLRIALERIEEQAYDNHTRFSIIARLALRGSNAHETTE